MPSIINILTYGWSKKIRELWAEINEAVLAYEITKMIHGEEEAMKAKSAAEALFGAGQDMSNVCCWNIRRTIRNWNCRSISWKRCYEKLKWRKKTCSTKWISVNDEKVKDFAMPVTRELFKDNEFLVKWVKRNSIK